jgi:single stranded DNA-binding protein
MKGFIKTTIIGRIGSEMNLTNLSDGKKVVRFCIAVPIPIKDKTTNTWIDSTGWYWVSAFDTQAEVLSQYTGKGSMIYLECNIRNEKWFDKLNNVEREKMSLIVKDFVLLGKNAAISTNEQNYETIEDSSKKIDKIQNNIEDELVDYEDDEVLPFI